MTHQVEFAETDMAGIMHFANFFRLMERTEHAFLRSLGFSVHMEYEGRTYGWPRVQASCEYLQPLRFEDRVEVELRVREKKPRAMTYDFVFRRGEGEAAVLAARGTITAVCVTMDADSGRMKAAPIPEALASQLEPVPVAE
jgi:acyl-CoA thioester hydrolase